MDNPHAVAADIGIGSKPNPVTDNMIELGYAALITILSNVFIFVFNI